MAPTIGAQAKLYRNTGTYSAPVWSEIKSVRSVRVSSTLDMVESSTRASLIRKQTPSLLSFEIQAELVWDSGDPNIIALRDTHFQRGEVDILALDGSVETSGSSGLRIPHAAVAQFERSEELEDPISLSVRFVPTHGLNEPEYFVVT